MTSPRSDTSRHSANAQLSATPSPQIPRGKAFSVVLAIELWERFGYYGMQAVLTLFMVEQLGFSDRTANLILGAFSALTYITPLLGGFIGDRVLGARRTMVLGAIALTVSYALLAASLSSHTMLFVAMALISTGNGLFKPNAGNLVRRIYEGDDIELDAAFTIYYMSANIGSTISMLLTPWLQIHYGANVAFGTCSAGLMIGLIYYAMRSRWLSGITFPLDRSAFAYRRTGAVVIGLIGCTALVAWILDNAAVARICVILAALVLIAGWTTLYRRTATFQRPGLRMTYLLCTQTMLYFIFYQQMVSSLTLFALRGVSGDFRLGGVTLLHLSAAQFQSFNSVWIMIFSPILAMLYNRLGVHGRDLSISHKMLCGFALVTGAFALWWLSAATAEGRASAWVMLAGYGMMSLGELLTTGLGLAVIARYAPPARSGFLIGGLYLLWGIAMYVGSLVANEAAIPPALVTAANATSYAPLFRTLTLSGAGIIALLICVEPISRRWGREHRKLNPPTKAPFTR